jgi:RNA polymerase sigma-70 factor (ECF subfamily)
MQPKAFFVCYAVRTGRQEHAESVMKQEDSSIAALLARDIDSHFKQFMLAYQHRLYGFLLRQTGNSQESEDIAQETFIRSYYALKDYPAQKIQSLQLRAWLFKIALNIFYNRQRSRTLLQTSLDSDETNVAQEIADEAYEPDEEVWRNEQRQEVEQLVTALPERYRVVINLYYFEELSYTEIADLLHQPVGTIKAQVHRGIALLGKTIDTRNQVG